MVFKQEMAPSPPWAPPPNSRPHEHSHHHRCRRHEHHHKRTPFVTHDSSEVQDACSQHPQRSVQETAQRRRRSDHQSTAPSTSIPDPRTDRGPNRGRAAPIAPYLRPPNPLPLLLNSHMSSLSTNGFPDDAILFLPNLVMKWTMSYANSVSRQQRSEYLRGLSDVEANMTTENDDELTRMLANDDSDQEDEAFLRGVGIEPQRRMKGKKKADPQAVGETSHLHSNRETWEAPSHASPARSSSLPPSFQKSRKGGVAESSRIQGVGLPVRSRQLASLEEGKQLPPTPEELTDLEAQEHPDAIPIEASRSWTTIPLRGPPPKSRSKQSAAPDDDKRSEVTDLGWPPVEDLFADLPEPVTPVFRREDLTDPVQTIWNRPHKTWLSPGHQTEEPTSVEREAASVHSSANDNPPSDLLAQLSDTDARPEDPSIFLRASFEPILSFLRQEWKTTRLLHRHLRYTLIFSPPPSPQTTTNGVARSLSAQPPNNTTTTPDSGPPVLLTREQREIRLALTSECRAHIDVLKKWYRNTKKCMELTIEAAQHAAAFRFGVEIGDAEVLAREMVRAGKDGERGGGGGGGDGDGDGSAEGALGLVEQDEAVERFVDAKPELTGGEEVD